MKKLLLLSLLCLSFNTFLRGQIEKGAIAFGGEIGLDYLAAEEESFSGFSYGFSPAFSLMVTDHWLLGASLGTSAFDDSANFSTIAPQVRYYLNPGSEGNNYYAGFRYERDFGDYEESSYNFQLGFNRFLNGNIALDASITYAIHSLRDNGFILNLGLQPFMNKDGREAWQSAVSTFNRGDLMISPGFASIFYLGGVLDMRFSPDVGLFLSDQTLVGVSLSGSYSNRLNNTFDYEGAHLSIAPYLRRYFGSSQKHWRWYSQVGLFLTGSGYETEFVEFDSWGSLLNGRLGTNWFLTSNLAFDIGLDLSYHLWTNQNGATRSSDFDGPWANRGFRIGASVGVKYFLQRTD
jgi:hypothetical protein